jgi:hypothetical protein
MKSSLVGIGGSLPTVSERGLNTVNASTVRFPLPTVVGRFKALGPSITVATLSGYKEIV